MMDDDKNPPDLSVTLRPEERANLGAAGLDPRRFVALDVPITKIAPGDLGRGALELRTQSFVPDTLFVATDPAKRRLFLSNGKIEAPNLKFGLAPTMRLIVAIEAIGDKAREEMALTLQAGREGKQGTADSGQQTADSFGPDDRRDGP